MLGQVPYRSLESQSATVAPSGALTTRADWSDYHLGLSCDELARRANYPTIFDDLVAARAPGHMFELGCGGSAVLARFAQRGWRVGGIDFSAESIAVLQGYLKRAGLDAGSRFIVGDVFDADSAPASGSADLMLSAGFLEHFADPAPILAKWSEVLKPGGLVLSAVPNLVSLNARLLERHDPKSWRQHVPFDAAQIDAMHKRAGLEIVQPAHYAGRYDIHMLIPWARIADKLAAPGLYRLIKLATFYGIGEPLRRLFKQPGRVLAPYILGVYARPSAAVRSQPIVSAT